MTYDERNTQLSNLRHEAKYKNRYGDKELAAKCAISCAQIRVRASRKELPNLDFWAVEQIAHEAGYEIIFIRKENTW